MIIYIDYQFKCHVDNPDGNFRAVETEYFDGKCSAYIEGYRYVPTDEVWVSPDGVEMRGMVAPWKDYAELDAAQRDYERATLADAENALAILLGGAV